MIRHRFTRLLFQNVFKPERMCTFGILRSVSWTTASIRRRSHFRSLFMARSLSSPQNPKVDKSWTRLFRPCWPSIQKPSRIQRSSNLRHIRLASAASTRPPLLESRSSAGARAERHRRKKHKKSKDFHVNLVPFCGYSLLPFDPDLAVFKEFFFPDRNDLFEFINRVMAGIEGGTAVGGCDDHSHTSLSDIEMAEAVNHSDGVDVPGLPDENSNLFQLFQSHRFIRLVDEMQRPFSLRIVAHDTFEYRNRAVLASQNL